MKLDYSEAHDKGTFSVFRVKKPKWQFKLAKDGDVVFHTCKAPTRFSRFMQWLFLGIYWRKVDEN